MGEQVVLRVGTEKGLFAFESDGDRRAWRLAGQSLPEWRVDALLPDPGDPDRLLVGTSHMAWGATVRETRDGGLDPRLSASAPDVGDRQCQRVGGGGVRPGHGEVDAVAMRGIALHRIGDYCGHVAG